MHQRERNVPKCGAALGLSVFLIFGSFQSEASGAEPTQAQKYTYSWDSLKTAPVPQWFDDAKFGIFIHWGPQSFWSSPWGSYQNPEKAYPKLKETFGKTPPEFGYKDVIPMFKAEEWDPVAWADLFEKAGAKYVVLVGEHHDGFQLGDSTRTDWCATKIGPMRDLIGDLGKAVRAKGLKYAPSSHRERHAGMFSDQRYRVKCLPSRDIAEEIKRDPKAAGHRPMAANQWRGDLWHPSLESFRRGFHLAKE
ncbi:Alpha-L-fucosidase [Novipirellula artificiosorum]|uniref:alpha-L-fucosidase n=2 Tax=Novipirellula artificiosorum TaxID=2528016 RepID=A0A5C6CSV5_9BACT|nr:Alpha-L-fucosidase [Novipirellula artificiosorum]